MATVYRENRKTPTRQYIATAAFNSYFFTYTLTTDPNSFVQTGTFSAVNGANAGNCPRGRILRETGERLFPGQSGVNTLMVKVFDPYSFLSGYIDPNAEVFAVYSTDKPGYVEDGFDNNATSGAVHRGPSMYTSGNVLADGNLSVGGTADISGALTVRTGGVTVTAGGLTVTAGGIVATAGTVRAATITNITYGSNTILVNATLGTVYQVTIPNGQAANVTINSTTVPPAGTVVYVIVTNGTQSGGPFYYTGAAGSGTSVSMPAPADTTYRVLVVASRTQTLTFCSNGANLIFAGMALAN